MQVHQRASLDRRLLVTTALLSSNVFFSIAVEKFRVQNFLVDFFLFEFAVLSCRYSIEKFVALPGARFFHSLSSLS